MHTARLIDYTKYPVPRSRHHVSPNNYLPADRISIEPHNYPPLYRAENGAENGVENGVQNLDCAALFANGRQPDYLDIGCGMGRFLLETALETALETSLAEPAVNILGIEVRKYAADWIAGVIAGEQLPNAACLWYNVANGLSFIATDSVQKIFYFFPDPWFKRRHHIRRAFTDEFLNECARVMKKDGTSTLYLMTDVPDVDEYQRRVMQRHGKFSFTVCDHDSAGDAAWGLRIRTNQEEFSRKKRIPYVRLQCRLV